ncbi:MAG TPA: hypothetical protein VIK18_26165 [Pirellulales bacterium]
MGRNRLLDYEEGGHDLRVPLEDCYGGAREESGRTFVDVQFVTNSPLEAKARIELNFRVAALEGEMRQRRREMAIQGHRIAYLEAQLAQKNGQPTYAEAINARDAIEAFTRELFGNVSVTERDDEETAGDRHFVFHVNSAATIDDLIALSDKWHTEVASLPNRLSGLFRLSLDIAK